MKKRIIGTIAGIGTSLGGVGLWIALSFVGYIAGVAGALIGVGFYAVYTLINKEDKSKYPIIIACILIPVGIAAAELSVLAILAAAAGIPLFDALSYPEIQVPLLIDLGVGLVMSIIPFIVYMVTARRRSRLIHDSRRVYTPNDEINPNPASNEPKNIFETADKIELENSDPDHDKIK